MFFGKTKSCRSECCQTLTAASAFFLISCFSFLHLSFSLLFSPLSMTGLRAQEVKQESKQKVEIIEEEDGDTESSSALNYWDEHFNASFGSSYAYGLDKRSYRIYSYARLAWKDDFDWVLFNVEGLAFRRDYQYSLELNPDDSSALHKDIQALDAEILYPIGRPLMGPPTRSADDICSTPSALPPMASGDLERLGMRRDRLCESRDSRQGRQKFILGIQDNELIWREAHAKFNIGEDLQFLAGWHTIVWGQLDFLSPVDFVLPFRLGSTGLGITKADNRNPQLAGILYYFPAAWLELQAYFFPDLGIESAFLNNFEEEVPESKSPYVDTRPVELPTGSERYRYAGRILFYLDQLTLGFTYYQGFFQFGSDENLRLSEGTKNSATIYNLRGESTLRPLSSFGIESAYPVGKWVWKMDSIYLPLTENLGLDVEDYNNQILGYLPQDEFFDKRKSYIDWILKDNGAKLEISDDVILSTIGVDADLDRWLLNLGILFFFTGRSSSEKEGFRLYQEAEDLEESPFASEEFFGAPIVNVAYYLSDKKKDAVGLAAGFLNTGAGLILYTAQEYFESLRLALSLEYLILFSNGLVNVEGYQLESPAYPAIRFIVDYQL